MKRYFKSILLFVFVYSSSLFGQISEDIKVNQVGYFQSSVKEGSVVGTSATTFEVRTLSDQIVYTGNLSTASNWNETNESVKTIDFSSFDQSGDFKIYIDGVGESYPFKINNTVLNNVSVEAMKYFYYNRASMELESQYAGIYARNGGHWDTEVIVCDNPFSGGRAEGSTFSSPGGWYDAGDYNKYLLTAGISTYTLLSTYEQHPDYVSNLNLNIPESSNGIPDVLDECLYEIDWLLTMQDFDGGVFTKLSNQGFGAFTMPDVHDNTNGSRYVCRKNTSATLQFAATLAAAYRIYEPVNHLLEPGERESWRTAAIAAWSWCQANPNVDAGQCDCSITTGGYGDTNQQDEFVWAAAELYLATGDISYYNLYNFGSMTPRVPGWQSDKESLGIISLLLNRDLLSGQALSDYNSILSRYLSFADGLLNVYNNHPYKIMMSNNWYWGSNGYAGNQSFIMLTAYHLSKNEEYLNAATSNIDYILGKNTTSYSWLTGFGTKQVMDAHHRISGGDGIAAPVPGMVFGGVFETADGFVDQSCCGTQAYANTEVTINWNAPFAFSTVALQAINSNLDGPFTLSLDVEGPGVVVASPVKTEYEKGDVVTITSVPNLGMSFSHWAQAGANSFTDELIVIMDGNKTVNALFIQPTTVPGIIESVNYDEGGQGVSYNDSDLGNTGDGPRQNENVDTEEILSGGYNVGWISQGEWLNYTIDVTESGTYDLEIDLASLSGEGSFHMEIDSVTVLAYTSILSTDDWAIFETQNIGELNLAQGIHKLRIVADEAGFNLGKLNFIQKSVTGIFTANQNQFMIHAFPNPSEKTVEISGYDGLATIYTLDGIRLKELDLSNGSFSIEELPEGTYFLHPKDRDYSIVRFIKN